MLTLFDAPETLETPAPQIAAGPDLRTYDLILVNTSAGKDSQATMDVVYHAAREAGVASRLVAVHADLGERIEHPGTKALAREHAAHYGIPFEVVRNPNHDDLLTRIEKRGSWPDAGNRFCTSEFKTGQVRKLMTALVRIHRSQRGVSLTKGKAGEETRILNVLGMRAQESTKRAGMLPFDYDDASSNTLRHVDEWLPIHSWTVEQVWQRIAEAGTRPHAAYAAGMPRLSCRFCVLASKSALVLSAKLYPDVAAEYAAAEARMIERAATPAPGEKAKQPRFKDTLTMADIIAAADRDQVTHVDDWNA